ncbi:MAG: type II secretion system GspH family protein [Proteobacteria bacterium]|nr:type II secretion system GspH family protein [Pseudomonadota bacterium]
MNPLKNKKGFTLFELILAVAVLGLIMTSFQGVLGQSLSTHKDTQEKLEQVSQARFAMDRIAMLIRETGLINIPVANLSLESSASSLEIEERIMNFYNNSTHSFVQSGDAFLDADNNYNYIINDNVTTDPVDWIIISLDTTDPDNIKLVEKLPDYSTADFADKMPERILCENVTKFEVTRGSIDEKLHHLVKIELALGSGINQLSFTTRAIAGKLLIL